MASRTEFTRGITFSGCPGDLFGSFGRWDDYCELTLPLGVGVDSGELRGIKGLANEIRGGAVDVRTFTGPPAMVCLLVDYSSSPEARERKLDERISSVFEALSRALPALSIDGHVPQDSPSAIGEETAILNSAAAFVGEDLPSGNQEEATVCAGAPVDGQPLLSAQEERGPVEPGMSRAFVAARFTDLALRQVWEGNAQRAIKTVDAALRYRRDFAPAIELRQNIRLLLEREKRRQREPLNPRVQLEAGFSFLLFHRYGEARESLRRASRLSPRIFLAHLLHGMVLHHLGEVEGAEAAYNRAADLCPLDPVPPDLIRSLRRGEPPPPLAESLPVSPPHNQAVCKGVERKDPLSTTS